MRRIAGGRLAPVGRMQPWRRQSYSHSTLTMRILPTTSGLQQSTTLGHQLRIIMVPSSECRDPTNAAAGRECSQVSSFDLARTLVVHISCKDVGRLERVHLLDNLHTSRFQHLKVYVALNALIQTSKPSSAATNVQVKPSCTARLRNACILSRHTEYPVAVIVISAKEWYSDLDIRHRQVH